MVISPRPADAPAAGFITGDWMARFEARSLDDIRALGRDGPEDDRAFAAVARLSELNLSALSRLSRSPFFRAVASHPSADLASAMDPLRLSYTIFGDNNPWMKGIQPLAAAVADTRRPVTGRQPVPPSADQGLGANHHGSGRLSRRARPVAREGVLRDFTAPRWMQALLGVSEDSIARPILDASPEKLAARQARTKAYKAMLETGGFDEALTRSVLYVVGITKAIENAQRKVEGHNYDIRKHLLEYDDVMNQQRKIVYAWRKEVLSQESLRPNGLSMISELANAIADDFFPNGKLRKVNGQPYLDEKELNDASAHASVPARHSRKGHSPLQQHRSEHTDRETCRSRL